MGFSLKNLLGAGVDKVVSSVGDAIDKNVTSKEEKLIVKKEITEILTNFSEKALDVQKEVVLAEIQGNKYQRSWRPSLMYMAMFIIFTTWFIFPMINIWAEDPNITEFINSFKEATDFWDIIKLGVGAFGIGRTAEKVVKDLSQNVDVSLRRNK